jgi:hypothetical protein
MVRAKKRSGMDDIINNPRRAYDRLTGGDPDQRKKGSVTQRNRRGLF